MTVQTIRKCWAEELALPPGDDDLARLFALWQAQRGGAPMPNRTTIRAEDLAFMLGRLNLIEVRAEAPRFWFRIFGTEIGKYRQGEMTGRNTGGLVPRDYRMVVEGHFADAHARQQPTLHQIYLSNGPVVRKYRRVILPYAADSGGAGFLLTGSHFPESTKEVVQSDAFLRDG